MNPAQNAALEYLFPDVPAPGTAREVAPGVLWLRMPLPFALDHINLWALADGAGWTLVDCGLGTEETRALWLELFDGPLRGRPVTRLIVTHCHPDHIGLAAWLGERFGLDPWMTKAEYLHAHTVYHRVAGTDFATLERWFERHGLDRAQRAALAPREDHYRRGVPTLPAAFHRLRPGDVIRIGEHDWHIIAGYGHSPEHAALYCPGLGLLIGGDMLLPRISTNVSVWPSEPDGDPLGEFLASLTRFEELPPATRVLPSHGEPFVGIASRVDALRGHHQTRLDEVMGMCTRPRAAAEVWPALFRRKLEGQQIVFAMGETIAHLNHLMHGGRLARAAADGVHRFMRRDSATGELSR